MPNYIYRVRRQCIQTVRDAYARTEYARQKDFANEAGVSLDTVSKFLNGKKIKRENFLHLADCLKLNWREIVEKTGDSEGETPSQTPPTPFHPFQPSTYNADTWVEREKPLAEATEHLRGNCRILLITGITGQGKTALAERVAEILQPEWQPLPGVNLDDETARNFEVAAEQLLVQMGETVQAEDRKQPQFLLNRLVKRLQENPYLVQIDSLEVLLEGKTDFAVQNEFRQEHRDWWQFCQRLLLSPACQSRLILTSQDLPTQFVSCKSRCWYRLPLSGLKGVEQMQLFEKLLEKRLPEVSLEAREYLQRMGKAYEGHPLVIEVIAGEIATDFAGDVVGYWRRYRQEFEEIEATPGNQQLQRRVKARVRQSLERLRQDSELAFGLLLAGSVYRRQVPESFWLAIVEVEDGENLLEILNLRGLTIRKFNPNLGEFFLRQHNLIRNTAGEWLRKKIPELWKAVHYIAAKVWLNQYQPEPDAENLEKVRGYLEAFYHCCQVEDWQTARGLLAMRVDSPTQEQLHSQLHTWGYYQQQIAILSLLVGKFDLDWDGICFNGIGCAYYCLGQYKKALDFHQKDLVISRKNSDFYREGEALSNIALAYFDLGDDRQAIEPYGQSLDLARQTGNLRLEGNILGNLGNAFSFLGKSKIANECYSQSLAIFRERDDQNEIVIIFGNLGNVFNSRGQYSKAIELHQQHLDISREIGNYEGEGNALANLGYTQFKLGRYPESLENTQRALEIFEKIGNHYDEAETLKKLAEIHKKISDIYIALEYCDRALKIATELSIPLAQECQALKERLLNSTSYN